jgi:hypothetical protein
MIDASTSVDITTRRQVVEQIADLVETRYVFPDTARAMADILRQGLAIGLYDDLDDPTLFCERVSADMYAISHDKHLKLRYREIPRADASSEAGADPLAEAIDEAQRENYGFHKVERMPGNIGYLDVRTFWEAGFPGAAEMASAAMILLANTDALIVDLRTHEGGANTMVTLLSSYLFGPTPVHLNSFYEREGDKTTQFWTFPHVQGKRTPDKPVYVLVSESTFSAAEEFAYNLKNLKRATIVGETTGGGANPGAFHNLTPHFRIFVPDGRAVNPISGTNWEGVGVKPDVAVPQAEALDRAYRLALETVLSKIQHLKTSAAIAQAKEARESLASLNKPSA